MSGTKLKALSTEDFITGLREVLTEAKYTQQDFDDYLQTHTFDKRRVPPDDVGILFYNGLRIGSAGNVVTITGMAKSRKTVVASALMTSIFSGKNFLGFHAETRPGDKVLHVDTEQAYHDYYDSVLRMIRDAELSELPDYFTSIHMRDAGVEFRVDLVDYLLKKYNPRILFLDGITDLIYNINEQKEVTMIGEKLLQWSAPVPGDPTQDRLIVVVIHTTKSTGYMTGSIGTYLEKKCETAIKVEKPADDENISHVSCQYARKKPFAPFTIEFDEKIERYVVVQETDVRTKGRGGDTSPEAYPEDVHTAILARVFNFRASLTKHELANDIKKAITKVTKDNVKARDIKPWIDFYNARALIIANPDGLWLRVDKTGGFVPLSQRTDPSIFDLEPVSENGHSIDELPF